MTVPDAVEILLIEDNDNDAILLMRALRKRNLSNHLTRLEDGEQALDYVFRRGAFADLPPFVGAKVILLDLKLPKVSGLEVLQALKADARTRDIPVVIVTSSDQDLDIQRAYRLGANSYVVKPVEAGAFMDAMSQLGLYWLLTNRPPM
ncbi:MAG TPA: response regulator [Roseiflexaceae bacterium]|nr:response regulator [Roseiflexaceae bacterium]